MPLLVPFIVASTAKNGMPPWPLERSVLQSRHHAPKRALAGFTLGALGIVLSVRSDFLGLYPWGIWSKGHTSLDSTRSFEDLITPLATLKIKLQRDRRLDFKKRVCPLDWTMDLSYWMNPIGRPLVLALFHSRRATVVRELK